MNFFKENEIIHQMSCVNISEQNSIFERKNIYILEKKN
jgi:hypothetical protein